MYMKTILHIISSPRKDSSVSRKLGSQVTKSIIQKYPGSVLREIDLASTLVPHLAEVHIDAFFTAAAARSVEQQAAILHADEWVEAVQAADILVVEAPMYNFTIPSTLKAFFDQITRAGVTFRYTGNGLLPEGLLKDKQAYIITSSGGIYSTGELEPYDFVVPYVRFFLTLVGIEVAGVFRAEGQAVIGQDAALQAGVESIAIQ